MNIHKTELKRGMIVEASYDKINQGTDRVLILGFTDNDQKYSEIPVYSSVIELLADKGCTSLAELEALEREKEYGHHFYIVAKDVDPDSGAAGDIGGWYYISEGEWCRGSGAEALTFESIGFDSSLEPLGW